MTEGNRFDNGAKWIFLLVVEMKSERRMRKAYLLKDIENFEKYYLWSLETKNLKPIFDGYVKNNLEQKLIEYDVDISTKDYRITDKWLLPEFEDANPFYFYYNIKFRDVYDLVSTRLGEVRISEDTFKEINNKPRLTISFLKMTIDLFIQDIFRGDLRLMYLLSGNLEKLKENEQKLSRKSKPEDESYKRNMNFVKRILNEKLSKYKVVKEFCENSESRTKFSEKSLANTFDVFLKNHKEEILSNYKLSEDEFNKMFFPKKYSKR